MSKRTTIQEDERESHGPAAIAAVVVGLLYLALPTSVAVGPRWLATVVAFGLMIPTVIANRIGWLKLNHVLGHFLSGALTLFMIWSLVLLVQAVPQHKEPPILLLRSAAALWIANVMVFALWYWRIDGGGPMGRDLKPGHEQGAFLFPQMMRDGKRASMPKAEDEQWSPEFIDYLFLAFNTSTAFSPTDTPVLGRWAKAMTMIQSIISLTVVVILAARAVNIL